MRGKAHKYGDNVNTDEIIPARYLNTSDPVELASHCMEDIDSEFLKKLQPGDIMVAGSNFGCGSSREHAPIAIKTAGVSAVIAETFARIFFRNSINIGLAIFECPEAARDAQAGDDVEIDMDRSAIINHTRDKRYTIPPFPPEMRKIIEAGGLMNFVKQTIKTGG